MKRVEWMKASWISCLRPKASDLITSDQISTLPHPPLDNMFPQMRAPDRHKSPVRRTICLRLCGSYRAAGSRSRGVRCLPLGRQNPQPHLKQDGETAKQTACPTRNSLTSSLLVRWEIVWEPMMGCEIRHLAGMGALFCTSLCEKEVAWNRLLVLLEPRYWHLFTR